MPQPILGVLLALSNATAAEPRLTHVGIATVLIEVDGFRILTDPAFDPAGTTHSFAMGTSSTITIDPSHDADAVGKVDAVLLSHDQHLDNLDVAGRAYLQDAAVGRVITTRPSRRRLARQLAIGDKVTGLRRWQQVTLQGDDGQELSITAVPARHGLSPHLPGVGKVTGFVLEWKDAPGVLYLSGDTVMFGGIRRIARRYRGRIDHAVLHCGAAQFSTASWLVRPFRFTMNAEEAVEAVDALEPRRVSPVHYDGCSHFEEPTEDLFEALEAAHGPRVRRPDREARP